MDTLPSIFDDFDPNWWGDNEMIELLNIEQELKNMRLEDVRVQDEWCVVKTKKRQSKNTKTEPKTRTQIHKHENSKTVKKEYLKHKKGTKHSKYRDDKTKNNNNSFKHKNTKDSTLYHKSNSVIQREIQPKKVQKVTKVQKVPEIQKVTEVQKDLK